MKKIWKFIKARFKWSHTFFYVLILALLVIVVLQYFKGCEREKQLDNLRDEIHGLDIGVRELREGVIESRTAVVEDISARNKELIGEEMSKAIKENKLDIVYASQVKMDLKLQEILKAKTKPVIVVNNDKPGQPVPPEVIDSCNTCLGKTTIRIPFEGHKGIISVSGYTETGKKIGIPGTYQLDIRAVGDILLNIVLAQNSKKQWKTIISNPDGFLEAYNIKASIDVRPFKPSFKERLSFPIGVAVGGQTAMLRTGIYIRLSQKIAIGLDVGALINWRTLGSTDGFVGIGFDVFPW